MKDFISLLNRIAAQGILEGTKPVSVQTAIMESPTEAKIDQNITVEPTLPKIYKDGIKFKLEGVINGYDVEGEVTLTAELKEGDKVKVIKEDGVNNKYYLTDQLKDETNL